MKKIIKLFWVLLLITYPFLYLTDWFFVHCFNFDYLNSSDWKKVDTFWQIGGTIKSSKDFLFLFLLSFLPIFFILCWYGANKIKYLKLVLFPIIKYNNYVTKKYGDNSKRIILKNITRTIKTQEALNEIKPDLNISKKASQTIRDAIREKLTNN